jgi:thiol-disulfide isomerase/thioredoxin
MFTFRLALAALLAAALPALAQAQGVELKTVRYDQLIAAVKAQQGKVVVVDFWADYCVPCKREFPHLVELSQKYGGDGLVAISVTLDDPTDDAAKGRALKFLQAQKATFTNYLLDEKPEGWQEKLKIDGPPLVVVFNRQGNKEKEFKDEVNYAEIEKLAVKLLKEK